ncbi:60S acidic ribosomal protein P1 [Echinococcus granulosus]|uniref:Large ribosomal subunit protein P1 n=1 Tax=Echinococcus granulosus TaxID=6210 RepID=U6JF89_ECHGR|nr:60S acidic ribosomal protein P1 [Echinococcus granulosus]EUB56730.1 60S acidic ribosomal protein P1 [Echinococcus granulosus]KAH9285547.1 60S acidic ribosomal protein P1 [Echinococcus granulosus]CDS22771.1 ribosomal protein lp1 [Echinococcus granulosus]
MDTKSEIACTYASLILADDDIEVTADKLNTLLKAANCKFVESYVTSLFANALSGRNIKDIVSATSSVSVAPAPAVAPGPAASKVSGAAPAVECAPESKKEEEKKREESEESDGDMGFDLFG